MSQESVDINRYLYEQIYSELKAEILAGKYKKGDWFPPERVLKGRFNTTHLTVRNALAKLVLEGYIERYSGKGTLVIYSREPSPPVRKSLTFPCVHVILARIDEANAHIMETLEEQMRRVPLPVRFSCHRGDVLLERSMYRGAQESGALVILEPAGPLGALMSPGVPLRNTIVIRSADPRIPCPQVSVDDRDGGRKAVRYLLDLGHRRLVLLSSTFSPAGAGLQEGFEAELEARGMPPGTGMIESCAPGIDGAAPAVRRITARDTCRAFLCASDETAAGAIRALRESGSIPGSDCSVIGYGNTRLAQGMGLTTVDPGNERLAERVITIAIEGMNTGVLSSDQFKIPAELCIRESCGRQMPSA